MGHVVVVRSRDLSALHRCKPAVVQRIERAVAEALRAPDARDKIAALGLVPDYLDSAGLKKLQAEQLKRWEQPVKASGFKPD